MASTPSDPSASTSATLEADLSFLCRYYKLINFAAVRCSVMLLGLVGNGISLGLLYRDRYKSATFFLLFALVCTDSLFLIANTVFNMPIYIARQTEASLKTQTLNALILYQYTGPVTFNLIIVKIYLTISVSWHRFLSTSLPFRAKEWGSMKIAKGQLIASVGIGMLSSASAILQYGIRMEQNMPVRFVILDSDAFLIYRIILNTAIYYVIPFLSLGVLSFLLLRGKTIAHC
jgi:hypothetical protein